MIRKIPKSSFDEFVKQFDKQNLEFVVSSKRNLHLLYYNQQLLLISKNPNNRFKLQKKEIRATKSLYGQVKTNVNKHLKLNLFNPEIVEKRFNSSKKNREKWEQMGAGEIFYYVDIKHCFWRIAFLKNYISKKLYERVLEQPEFKVHRNMSLALIIAPESRAFHKNGKVEYRITEEKGMYNDIYNNIRYVSYNLMGDCMELAGKHFISYMTDGIMVDKPALKKIEKFIKNQNFFYTVVECSKIDKKTYQYGEEIKKF